MSEIAAFEDLLLLQGNDLKTVFEHLPRRQAVAALWGCTASARGMLLRRMPSRYAAELRQALDRIEHLSFTEVRDSQHQAVRLMYRLSRAGLIAFDAPEDMVA